MNNWLASIANTHVHANEGESEAKMSINAMWCPVSNNIIYNKLTEPAIVIAIHLHNQWGAFVSPITFFSVQVHWEGADLIPISLIDHNNMS